MKYWLTAILMLVAQPAFAHAMLEHASPAAGSTVTAPKEIVLQYSESLEPSFSTVEVRGHDGVPVAAKVEVNDTVMRVTLKTLPPGRYTVTWHAVSVDTHRTQGRYSFTVKP
ncbi:MAG TPA: copper homeostasis periplasmic binding protein CopC [Rhizomicrobium sp.]|jgi:hypothetical protein